MTDQAVPLTTQRQELSPDVANLLAAWAREPGAGEAPVSIQELNSGCFCVSLDDEALSRALQAQFGSPEIVQLVRERCPYLFSARPVFVSHAHMDRMARVVRAVEAVVAMPAYRDLSWRVPPRSPGTRPATRAACSLATTSISRRMASA